MSSLQGGIQFNVPVDFANSLAKSQKFVDMPADDKIQFLAKVALPSVSQSLQTMPEPDRVEFAKQVVLPSLDKHFQAQGLPSVYQTLPKQEPSIMEKINRRAVEAETERNQKYGVLGDIYNAPIVGGQSFLQGLSAQGYHPYTPYNQGPVSNTAQYLGNLGGGLLGGAGSAILGNAPGLAAFMGASNLNSQINQGRNLSQINPGQVATAGLEGLVFGHLPAPFGNDITGRLLRGGVQSALSIPINMAANALDQLSESGTINPSQLGKGNLESALLTAILGAAHTTETNPERPISVSQANKGAREDYTNLWERLLREQENNDGNPPGGPGGPNIIQTLFAKVSKMGKKAQPKENPELEAKKQQLADLLQHGRKANMDIRSLEGKATMNFTGEPPAAKYIHEAHRILDDEQSGDFSRQERAKAKLTELKKKAAGEKYKKSGRYRVPPDKEAARQHYFYRLAKHVRAKLEAEGKAKEAAAEEARKILTAKVEKIVKALEEAEKKGQTPGVKTAIAILTHRAPESGTRFPEYAAQESQQKAESATKQLEAMLKKGQQKTFKASIEALGPQPKSKELTKTAELYAEEEKNTLNPDKAKQDFNELVELYKQGPSKDETLRRRISEIRSRKDKTGEETLNKFKEYTDKNPRQRQRLGKQGRQKTERVPGTSKLKEYVQDNQITIPTGKTTSSEKPTVTLASELKHNRQVAEEALDSGKLINFDYAAERTGETEGKPLSTRKSEMVYETYTDTNGVDWIRTVDSNGQMKRRALYGGENDSRIIGHIELTKTKSKFYVDDQGVFKRGPNKGKLGRTRVVALENMTIKNPETGEVIRVKAGQEVPQFNIKKAKLTSERVAERNAELEKAGKGFTDEEFKQALNNLKSGESKDVQAHVDYLQAKVKESKVVSDFMEHQQHGTLEPQHITEYRDEMAKEPEAKQEEADKRRECNIPKMVRLPKKGRK